MPTSAAAGPRRPPRNASTPMPRGLLVIGACGVGLVCIGAAMLADAAHLEASETAGRHGAAAPRTPSVLLQQAAAALAANRLTEPSGNNALELYLRELALDPGSSAARAGLAETRERLYARAQVALLEERLDPAAAAIETARKAGVESGRIALLTTELAKARDEAEGAAARHSGQGRTWRPLPNRKARMLSSGSPPTSPSHASASPSGARSSNGPRRGCDAERRPAATSGPSDPPPSPAAAAPVEPAAPKSESPPDTQAAKTAPTNEST
jgi:periplasmic protein TonB